MWHSLYARRALLVMRAHARQRMRHGRMPIPLSPCLYSLVSLSVVLHLFVSLSRPIAETSCAGEPLVYTDPAVVHSYIYLFVSLSRLAPHC